MILINLLLFSFHGMKSIIDLGGRKCQRLKRLNCSDHHPGVFFLFRTIYEISQEILTEIEGKRERELKGLNIEWIW